MTHPGGRPAGSVNEVQQRVDALAEERSMAALRVGRRKDMEAIHLNKTRGMSRKRLIEIYGRELVDMALAP